MSDNETSSRTTLIAFAVISLMILVGAVVVISARPQPVAVVVNPPLPTATLSPSATPGPITVYVTGAVARPESIVQLPVGSRVQDVIEAVGGVADDADLARVNLAAIVRDGDQVHVVYRDEVGQAGIIPALATPSGGEKVAINTALNSELQQLSGIGPVLAARIVAYREEYGPFRALEDLGEVPGIGDALIEQLAPLIRFD